MLKHFVRRHISKLLNTYEVELKNSSNQAALDVHCRKYFKENKNIGGQDRKQIYDHVYKLVRNKIFLDVISPKPLSWEGRLDTLKS